MTKSAVRKKSPEIPHHTGHRDRLRQRFLKAGPDGVQDYELLELILFGVIPRRDVKPLAKSLLHKYGNISAVFAATPEDLQDVKGISENAAIALKTIQAAAHQMLKDNVMEKPVLGSWQALLDYCHATMAYEKKEHFRLLFLDKKNTLIADEVQQSGTIDHAPVYPREVVKRALDLGATALILVHNHPSGDATPSRDDIEMTKELSKVAAALGVTIHDHIIIAHSGHASFKSMGLL